MPPKAISSPSATSTTITPLAAAAEADSAPETTPGSEPSATSASTAPRPATTRPVRPLPCANSAVRTTRRNECGFEVAGGTCTYLLRPAQKITDATAISRPGMPNATLGPYRSEEHTTELQSLMRISYAVFCLKKKKP